MKINQMLLTAYSVLFFATSAYAADPLVPCKDGYKYTCDAYGICGCYSSSSVGSNESLTINSNRGNDSLLSKGTRSFGFSNKTSEIVPVDTLSLNFTQIKSRYDADEYGLNYEEIKNDFGGVGDLDEYGLNYEEIKNDPNGLGEIVLNFEEIKDDLDGPLFNGLREVGYTPLDAEFAVQLVRSYGLLRGQISLSDDFLLYLYRSGLTPDDASALSYELKRAFVVSWS